MTPAEVLELVFAFLGTGALFTFITFLINRKDNRNDKLKEIIESIHTLHQDSKQSISKVSDAVNTLREDMNTDNQKLRNALDENKAITARVRILRASDEILHNMKHSKEWFDQLNDDITFYETYCAKHPEFRNNKATHAIANINAVYAKALQDNDFL